MFWGRAEGSVNLIKDLSWHNAAVGIVMITEFNIKPAKD